MSPLKQSVKHTIWVLVATAAIGAAGCFGDRGLSCEDPSRYAASRTVPPVRVPSGLTVPDESQALDIPSGQALTVPGEDEPPPCLERPPDFFDEDADDAQ
jgi:uncharacterized lipoprotein